jgi:hypothetical protein
MSVEAVSIHWESFKNFVNEFKNESDRAAVILGAAKLDAVLAQILDRYFLPTVGNTDDLIDGDSPLSTFSARIAVCYRLGLISAEFAKALHQVRKIRNSFAHDLSGCSLNSGPQSDRLKALLLPWRPLPFFTAFRKHFFADEVSPSIEFKALLAIMIGRLETRLTRTNQTSEAPIEFIRKSWSEKQAVSEQNQTTET